MINLNEPHHLISLNEVSKPAKILRFMKRERLNKYCYAFCVRDRNVTYTMNIGMSEGAHVGDRAYRKCGNLYGFGHNTLTGDFGSDMKAVVKRFENKFPGIQVHKDNVILKLWDTSNIVVDSYNSATVECEKKLFRDCKAEIGCIPAGNIQDPNDRNRQTTTPSVWNDLFEDLSNDKPLKSVKRKVYSIDSLFDFSENNCRVTGSVRNQ